MFEIFLILIFLSLVFSVVNTFTEIKASSQRKRRRRQGAPNHPLGRMDSQAKPRSRAARNAGTGQYNDPVFNSRRPRKAAEAGQQRNQEARPMVSTREVAAEKRREFFNKEFLDESSKRSISPPTTMAKKKPRKTYSSSSPTRLKGKQLRQAMIYKEILDKPVSMREQ